MAHFSGFPYFLLLAGLFFSLTSATAFFAMLRGGIQDWIQRHSVRTLPRLEHLQILIPYLGICFGVWLMLTAGIGAFKIPMLYAFLAALVVTAFLGQLVWTGMGHLIGRRVIRSYTAESSELSRYGGGRHA